MSRRVNQVDEVLVGRGLGFWGCPSHQPEVERDCGGLHGDAAELLVGSRIEIADATGEFAGDDAIGGKKAVGKGSFAMILHRWLGCHFWLLGGVEYSEVAGDPGGFKK